MNFSKKSIIFVMGFLAIADFGNCDEIQPEAVSVPDSNSVPEPIPPVAPEIVTQPLAGSTPDSVPSKTVSGAKGEAVTTETRTPEGNVITVTRYNGEIPDHIFQSYFRNPWFAFPHFAIFRPYFF